MENIVNNETSVPFSEKFIFQGIVENQIEKKRFLYFYPPLTINYKILEKINKETGKENYKEEFPSIAYITFDFGMTSQYPIFEDHPLIKISYQGLTKQSSKEDVLMYSLIYDLFHALCESPYDNPHYDYLHWAICGNLKGRYYVTQKPPLT